LNRFPVPRRSMLLARGALARGALARGALAACRRLGLSRIGWTVSSLSRAFDQLVQISLLAGLVPFLLRVGRCWLSGSILVGDVSFAPEHFGDIGGQERQHHRA